MPFTETGAEKVKRKAYEKGNRERGIEMEKSRDYKMFGTTEQNIPSVNPMGNVTGMKKGGKVRRFSDGGMSLEEMYPEAKITRAGPQPKPVEDPPKTILQEALREVKEAEYKDLSKKAELAPYEKKAETKRFKGGSGSARGSDELFRAINKPYKAGGSVSSASKRADGCAIRGKTRA